ncbi:MAG: hypothetical protein H3C36_15405, partial [Chitinophagaceae bacterium]|nr:hypothetical protein [Chitinophagaceae bacterium]
PDLPNDPKELITRIDLSSKVGAELKARVGPELILSLINIPLSYRGGFDGVASFSSHVGPALAYRIETGENPDIVVQKLGAPRFGISAYEWTGSLGGDNKLALHFPVKWEREFSLDPVRIKFLHYADYDIHYKDGPVGSREFEVTAASSDYWQWNDAKLMQGATRWHVIEPGDAVLDQNRADPLQVSGRWSNQYSGDSIIVLEYTPDTLASMVLGLSEATRPVAKQYKLLMPKFLLEGEWNYEYTRFQYDALKFLTGIPKNIYEMMSKGSLENDTFIVNMPPCDMYGSPAFSGSSQFLYNAVQKNYWVETTVLDSKLKMYRVGRFAISELVHSADEILAVFSLDLECVPALSGSLPIISPAERLSNTKVERMMTSEELGKVFSPKAGAPDGGAASGMAALANSMVMSGAIQMKTKVDLKGPDEFVANAQAIHGTETLFDFEILYKRKKRQED